MEQVKICKSCGKVIKKIEDYANMDINSAYCNNCTDEFGYPKRYSKIIQQTKEKLVKQMAISEEEAEKIALENVVQIPHWANKEKLLANKKHILITDIGSTTTKALLLEKRESLFEIKSIFNAGTTVEKPNEDVNIGVLIAIKGLEQNCKIKLMDENNELNDDILYISTSSAGGGLQILVIGLTMFDSASSAKRTAFGAGGVILDTFAIDDKRSSLEQMKSMSNLHPDIILMSGGVDGGAISPILRLGEILQLANPEPKFGDSDKIPLIYAGNVKAQSLIAGVFEKIFNLFIVPNLRPKMMKENLTPAREKIHQLFMDNVMEQAPGYKILKEKIDDIIIPTPMGVIRSLQIISESNNENVMSVDIGGATTDIFSNILGKYYRTVSANYGMSYSISNVMKDCEFEQLQALIPKEITENDARNYISNKMLCPTYNPTETHQIAIEHAIAQKAIEMSKIQHLKMNFNTRELGFLDKMKQKERGLEKIREAFYTGQAKDSKKFSMDEINIMIGAGGVLAHTQNPRQALAIIYQGLSPQGITEIWRDQHFISPHLGKLSAINESLSTKLLNNECYQKLALTIRPMGSKWKPGTIVMKVEFEGKSQNLEVGEMRYFSNENHRKHNYKITLKKDFYLQDKNNFFEFSSSLPVFIDCTSETNFDQINQTLNLFDLETPQLAIEDSFSSFIQDHQIITGQQNMRVKLPYQGDVLVKVGDEVNPQTIIGENKYAPPRIYVISLFDKPYLNLTPETIGESLRISKGQEVRRGQRIVEIGKKKIMDELKFQHFFFDSPVRGMVEKINHNSGTIIMREIQDYSNKPKTINGAKTLNIKPKLLPRYLSRKVGDFVYSDDVLGKILLDSHKAKVPLVLNAPTTGTITEINKETGNITIQYNQKSVRQSAGIFGKIESIEPGVSANISYQGSTLFGIIGFGKERTGKLHFIGNASEIANCRANEIAVISSKITIKTLKQASQQKLAGIIAASIDNSDLVDFIGKEIGVALTGNEDIPFPLIITEGFGNFTLNDKYLKFFQENNGKTAFINGHTQIRAGVTRPKIIVCDNEI